MTRILINARFTDFPPEALKAARAASGLRRADRFTSLALHAVTTALRESDAAFRPEEAALITLSSFGPATTTLSLLDDIIGFPEDQIRPTAFSHSVHNAVTSYLGGFLGIHGPSFALTAFEHPEDAASSLAEAILAAGQCRQVLVVAISEADDLTAVLPKLMPERYGKQPEENVSVTLLEN